MKLYLGLDVHKDSTTIAIAESSRKGEVRTYGTISSDLHAVEKALSRIKKAHPNCELETCYEAGPTGFVLARRLEQLKIPCLVAAPSLIPQPSGERIKTDKRDANKLARLLRAGESISVYIPEPTDEAIRDLCRARTDAVDDLKRNKQRLKAFLLRSGYRYQGKANWSAAHMRYLREIVLAHPAQKTTLEDYLQTIDSASDRIARCEANMTSLLSEWRLKDAVLALMAFKGFQMVAAMITVSELGDIHRFYHPRQVMSYLGLISTEHSSGSKRHQGAISRCGNGHLRWLLIECSHHYATPPKVSKELSKRQEGLPKELLALSWKTQNRLHTRFKQLLGRKLHRNKAQVAIARELCGFIWAALKMQQCYNAHEAESQQA